MKETAVINFYDNFVNYQKKSKVNDRIYALYKRAKKYGLKNNSNILELGSGIGVMTYLLSKTVKKGIIETVDISSKSVQFAQKNIKKKNIRFFVDDIVHYSPELNKIDFITLFDVIEHIPKEKHFTLFQHISSYMDEGTLLLINIPNPEFIEYDQKFHPEVLQVVDQPIHLDFLVQNLEKNGLGILHFEKYSIWTKHDYIFYLVEKKRAFKIEKERSFFKKVAKKLLRIKIKMLYRYY